MASTGGIWGPAALRLLRLAAANTSRAIRTAVAEATKPLQKEALPLHTPVPVPAIRRATTTPPPPPSLQYWNQLPTTGLLGLGKTDVRWFSSGPVKNINLVVRRCISSEAAAAPAPSTPRLDRSKLSASLTAQKVAQLPARSCPFASALRPNLTGGVLPRTAGGYGLTGLGASTTACGVRYFSHTPAAPAQVVDNVSQAVRAFFSSGRKVQYDGLGPRGDPQYRAVSPAEDAAMRKLASSPHFAPGAHVDFHLNPTVTALGPLAASGRLAFDDDDRAVTVVPSLRTDGFLDVLSADFGRALKNLTAVFGDLQRLSALGDLPISLEGGNVIRVRFPGVDRDTAECLCEDMGIQRGLVGQDQDLQMDLGAQLALRFPFAPDVLAATPTSPVGSERSSVLDNNEWQQQLSSLGDESFVHEAFAQRSAKDSFLSSGWTSGMDCFQGRPSPSSQDGQQSSDESEGLEGIYRFLEECDRAKGRLG